MSISGVMSSAVSGLNASYSKLAVTADNIANVTTAGYEAKEVRTTTLVTKQNAQTGYASGGVQIYVHERGQVDLANEFTNLMQTHAAYAFNAQTLKAGEEMSRILVDVLA